MFSSDDPVTDINRFYFSDTVPIVNDEPIDSNPPMANTTVRVKEEPIDQSRHPQISPASGIDLKLPGQNSIKSLRGGLKLAAVILNFIVFICVMFSKIPLSKHDVNVLFDSPWVQWNNQTFSLKELKDITGRWSYWVQFPETSWWTVIVAGTGKGFFT